MIPLRKQQRAPEKVPSAILFIVLAYSLKEILFNLIANFAHIPIVPIIISERI